MKQVKIKNRDIINYVRIQLDTNGKVEVQIEESKVLAHNKEFLVLNDLHFTTISKEKDKYNIRKSLNKVSTGEFNWGSTSFVDYVHGRCYSTHPVYKIFGKIKYQMQEFIKKKHGMYSKLNDFTINIKFPEDKK